MYGEGNIDLADVPVRFKNFGNDQTILFRLERDKRRAWKITEIFYPDNEDSASSLSKILSAQRHPASRHQGVNNQWPQASTSGH